MQDNLRRFEAGLFQALAHPTRIAIVELLLDNAELPVRSIYQALDIEQANASQHLAVMRARQIVSSRKDGNQVFYSLCNPIIGKVLDLVRQYFHAHLQESLSILKDLETDANTPQ